MLHHIISYYIIILVYICDDLCIWQCTDFTARICTTALSLKRRPSFSQSRCGVFFPWLSHAFPDLQLRWGGRCNSQYSSRMEAWNQVEPRDVSWDHQRFFPCFLSHHVLFVFIVFHDFCGGLSQPVPSPATVFLLVDETMTGETCWISFFSK